MLLVNLPTYLSNVIFCERSTIDKTLTSAMSPELRKWFGVNENSILLSDLGNFPGANYFRAARHSPGSAGELVKAPHPREHGRMQGRTTKLDPCVETSIGSDNRGCYRSAR